MQIKYKWSNYISVFKHTAIGTNFFSWMRVWASYGCKVGLLFWPKFIFISLTALVNTPFHWLEKLIYQRKINRVEVKKPIFILGHHRSGTTFLHYVLSRNPQFAYCSTNDALVPNSMLLVGNITERILGFFMPSTRPQDNVRAGASMPKEEEFALGNIGSASSVHGLYFPKYLMKNFEDYVEFSSGDPKKAQRWKRNLDGYLKKLTLKNKGKQLVLKSPSNTARVKEILELYPDAIFIHIHRNPYTVFQSNLKLYEKVLPLLSLHAVSWVDLKEYLAKSYQKTFTKFFSNISEFPKNQIFEVSYESFTLSPLDELSKMYDHLKLGDFEQVKPYFLEELKAFDGYQKNTHSSLSSEDLERVNSCAKEVMKRYGYTLEKSN